jgi:rhomboid protease GluP
MESLKIKLRLFVYPFLLVAISFIAIYSFLHWLLVIEWGLINVKEDILQIWVPVALSLIVTLIWINPRLKLLRLNQGKNNVSTLYYIVAAGAIAITAIIVQDYVKASSGKITSLQSIHEINSVSKTKYYTLQRYYIDKPNAVFHSTATVSGKYNANLHYQIYIVVPIYEKQEDTAQGECSNWLGLVYKKQISNKISDSEKEGLFNAFATESEANYEATDLQQFSYLERMGNTDEHEDFDDAIRKSELIKREEPEVFVASHGAFENRAGNKPWSILKSFGIGFAVWLLFILIPKLNEDELQKWQKGKPVNYNELKDILSMLVPRPEYYATPIIMNINLAVFLVMVFAGLGFISFKGIDLIHWGGNFRPATAGGEWWRLLTNVFLHGGVIHIFVNMFSLVLVGIFLEPVLGTKRFALFYILCGILASVTSLWWHTNTVSVGASGAIFGLYGIFLALLLLKVFPREMSKAFLISTLVFVAYNLLMGIRGGIDNAAHIGGLLSGFIIGLMIAKKLKPAPTT